MHYCCSTGHTIFIRLLGFDLVAFWVYIFHSCTHFSFGHTFFTPVHILYLGMHFSFGYTLYIFHSGIYIFHLGIQCTISTPYGTPPWCTGMKNVCPNEKMYIQNATQSKPNLMKIVCPDTGYTQINSTP